MNNHKKVIKIVAGVAAISLVGIKVYRKLRELKSIYNYLVVGKSECLIYDDEFDGDSLALVASDMEIDLSGADFFENELYLDLYATASRVEIVIPSDVDILLEGSTKLSSISVDQDESIEKTKVLHIHYHLLGAQLSIIDIHGEMDHDLPEE